MSVDEALRSRHSNDLIVPECKDGPTHGASHLRLDYWVLRRSWVRPAMIGYEVKSGRADWLADNKWRNYLPLCNELWFIAPDKSAIKEAELPENVGLLRLAGSRLVTVRRAAWREIECPEALLTYVLMCRTRIKGEHVEAPEERREAATDRWRTWLAKEEERRDIGWNVSKALRERYDREVKEVREQNEKMRSRIEFAEGVIARLREHGLFSDEQVWLPSPERVADEYAKVDVSHRSVLENARKALDEILGPRSANP